MINLFARLASALHKAETIESSDSPDPKGRYAGRSFVLDGTNIALLHGPARPELRYVLAIAQHIADHGGAVSCLFDANTKYRFGDKREEQLACFEKLTSQTPWATVFQVVPGGTQADAWILAQAKQSSGEVISNDRFKDRAKAHRWIWKRRHGLFLSNDRLQVPSLEVVLELLPQPEDYLPALSSLPCTLPEVLPTAYPD